MNRTEFIGTDLYYSQDFVDDKNKEIERLNNIIQEVREYLDIDENIRKTCKRYDVNGIAILEILDKGE